MVHAWCVFDIGIHPSRTWISESFESMWWNACVHWLDLSLNSHIRNSFQGMESEPMLTPREKSHLPQKFSSDEDWTHNSASSRTASPIQYQWTIPAPGGIQKASRQCLSSLKERMISIEWIKSYPDVRSTLYLIIVWTSVVLCCKIILSDCMAS